jgi:hypothetical protein
MPKTPTIEPVEAKVDKAEEPKVEENNENAKKIEPSNRGKTA